MASRTSPGGAPPAHGFRASLPRLAATLGLGLLACFAPSAARAGTIVHSHADEMDPIGEGWGITSGDTTTPGVLGAGVSVMEVGPLAPDPVGGLDAWGIENVTGSGRLRYEVVPVTAPASWTLRARMRVAVEADALPGDSKPVDAGIILEYSEGPGGNRHGLLWGADVSGNPIVGFLGDTTQITIPGGNAYAIYELTSTGELYVDGVLVHAGYAGVDAGAVARRVNFGDGQGSALGRSHWALVEWEEGPQACSDGIDNDGDGVTDFSGGDPSCAGPGDATENVADEDGDGLSDGDEILIHGTDPLDPDTDDDGLTDLFEVVNGMNPLVAGEEHMDPDGDGLDNLAEQAAGTDPGNPDTDGDGLSDGAEILIHGTNPLNPDTDGDGLSDGAEVLTHGTNPLVPDTDGDGLSDAAEVNTHGTDPTLADTDGDGLSDGEEVLTQGTDPLDPDTDGDGLSDGDEVLTYGSDPHVLDTDEDSVEDGDEVLITQTDPAVPQIFREQAWVAEIDTDSILRIDMATGARTILTGSGSIGAGPALPSVFDMELDAAGNLWVADFGANQIFHVDPVSKDRTTISGAGVGAGTALVDPVGIALDPGGGLLVTDFGLDAVLHVDTATGDRTEISDASLPGGGSLGSGPSPTEMRDVEVEASGDILILDVALDAVLRVNPSTGDRVILSSSSIGAGPAFADPHGLEIDGAGRLWVATGTALVRIDPVTGDRTVVSDAATGSGPAPGTWVGLSFDGNGDLLVADLGTSSLVRVDAVTGDRSVVSGGFVGFGLPIANPREVVWVAPLDQDGDGLSDLFEVENGMNPLAAGEEHLDPDGDGLDNLGEQLAGSDPGNPDTDGDGLSDGQEVLIHGTDPTKVDTDGDALGDGAEVAVHGTNPTLADTDGDGLGDGYEVNTYGTDPTAADTDGDGLGDGEEVLTYGSDPNLVDSDGDGLGDGEEVLTWGSSPTVADSDDDGVDDGDEVAITATPPAFFNAFREQLVVTALNLYTVFWVDRASGDRRVMAGLLEGTQQPIRGWGVALDGTGQVLVVDLSKPGVTTIDPLSGAVAEVTGPSVGSGPSFLEPTGLAVEAGGDILVLDHLAPSIVRVNRPSGDRSIVSGVGTGTGTAFADPWGIAVDGSGDIYVADLGLGAVLRVDPASGDRTVVSSAAVGAGPALGTPVSVQFGPSGQMWVVTLGSLFLVDPATGDRTEVSGPTTGTGINPGTWVGLGLDASGNPLITTIAGSDGFVLSIDPVTGDRTEISGVFVGGGTSLDGAADVVRIAPLDRDGDGLTDLFEVTYGLDPFMGGEEHQDTDGDGLDALAEQAAGTDPGDPDTDDDGVLDGGDNCPLAANPGQADFDLDGEGDVCDTDDGRIRIVSVTTWEFTWEPEIGSYDGYNVYRGDLETLAVTGVYSQPGSVPEAAAFCGLSGNMLTDFFVPDPGEGVFYLVAGTLGGVEGPDPLDVDGSGTPRPHDNPCPVP